jgi:hypothetical protein
MLQQVPEEAKARAYRDQAVQKFRAPLGPHETVEDRLRQAGESIAFLRIITPKTSLKGESGRWVYRNGERIEDGEATRLDKNGRVLSNFAGYNLDPCAVKRHKASLKRAGFVNNLHAKGIF